MVSVFSRKNSTLLFISKKFVFQPTIAVSFYGKILLLIHISIRVTTTKNVVAKTTFPKIGTEITFTIGRDLVPVVRGNSGERGYIWSFPTKPIQIGDTIIQLYGLKTLIQQVFPELLPRFSGKPLMSYIDGVTLAANIPMTQAIIREQQRKERIDAQAGIGW